MIVQAAYYATRGKPKDTEQTAIMEAVVEASSANDREKRDAWLYMGMWSEYVAKIIRTPALKLPPFRSRSWRWVVDDICIVVLMLRWNVRVLVLTSSVSGMIARTEILFWRDWMGEAPIVTKANGTMVFRRGSAAVFFVPQRRLTRKNPTLWSEGRYVLDGVDFLLLPSYGRYTASTWAKLHRAEPPRATLFFLRTQKIARLFLINLCMKGRRTTLRKNYVSALGRNPLFDGNLIRIVASFL